MSCFTKTIQQKNANFLSTGTSCALSLCESVGLNPRENVGLKWNKRNKFSCHTTEN